MISTPSRIDDLQTVSRQKAADLMDIDEDTVTGMLRSGDLRGTKTKGMIRVYVWSIDAYQKKNEIIPRTAPAEENPVRPRARNHSAAHRQAVRELDEMGLN